MHCLHPEARGGAGLTGRRRPALVTFRHALSGGLGPRSGVARLPGGQDGRGATPQSWARPWRRGAPTPPGTRCPARHAGTAGAPPGVHGAAFARPGPVAGLIALGPRAAPRVTRPLAPDLPPALPFSLTDSDVHRRLKSLSQSVARMPFLETLLRLPFIYFFPKIGKSIDFPVPDCASLLHFST